MVRAMETATDATLAAKLQALEHVARACRLTPAHLGLATVKTRRGHHEHDDAATVDLTAELQAELADVAGYGALCLWRGQWSWRLWAVVALAGVQWRLLRCRPPHRLRTHHFADCRKQV